MYKEIRLRSAPVELQPKLIKLKVAGATASNKNGFDINYLEICVQQICLSRDCLCNVELSINVHHKYCFI